MKKEVVSIYVDNKANVLTRVVSLYGRRGFNIDSLTVSATNDPDVSRITVTFEGDNLTLHQIMSQTEKLEVVRSIKALDDKRSFFRELLMVKVAVENNTRREIKEVVDIYRAKIISFTKDEMVLELTGVPEKLDAFLDVLSDYDIIDICRTGITGIEK
ncbi:MAG: acetolactate synthase small subunit [Anaerovoracaceae bacterium]|nr:acetolactate synthase small subunit [Bacillota bacterium]MEE0516293.1 acetolactate synthase small subunit [Anaerovoracaceae bacterium]